MATIDKELQRDLIKFYRKEYSMIPVSPLVEENDTSLLEFYVPPSMQAIDVHQQYGQFRVNTIRTPVENYQQLLFLNSANSFKNIYVTANAGVGKTTFCQHICLAWCQAHDQTPSLTEKFRRDDIYSMEFYEFLFFITLRDVDKSLCDLDELVQSFVKYNLPKENRYWELIDKILNTKTCLIILDGLDEWTHPKCHRSRRENDIPHSKVWDGCSIMTTTRPWKFDEIRISSKNVDRYIEICELDDPSSKQLVANAMEILNINTTSNQQTKLISEFCEQIKLLNLESIYNIPYVNLQMVCVWCEKHYIGKTKTENYNNMAELTLERGIQNRGEGQVSVVTEANPDIPHCLRVRPVCRKYGSLLLKLGKLAFHTLFRREDQVSLVFDKTVALQFLESHELTFCLNLGFLSQNKGYGSISRRQSNVCFQHKSMHEYFAALCIQSELENEETNKMVLKFCSSPSSILQMSNVFIFLSGLNPDSCSRLFNRLIQIASADKFVQTYRTYIEIMGFKELYFKTMSDFQNLQVMCVREGMKNNFFTFSLNLEDVILEDKSRGEQCMSVLEHVLSRNARDVKSVVILVSDSEKEFTEHVLKRLNLISTRSLVKLVLWTSARHHDVVQLLLQNKSTLRCICLGTSFKKLDHSFGNKTQLSGEFIEAIKSMPTLQNLILAHFDMDHDQLDSIAKFFSQCSDMTQAGIFRVGCKTHRESCPGVSLDLSLLKNIRRLIIHEVPISQIKLKTEVLEECEIGVIPVIQSFQSLLDQLPFSLQRLYCKRIIRASYIPVLFEKIPDYTKLKVLYLYQIKLDDQKVNLSSAMKNIEWVIMWEITMRSSVLRELINSISNLPQFVSVKIENCELTTPEEFEEIKWNIKKSNEKFLIILNGRNEFGRSEFLFQTVKPEL